MKQLKARIIITDRQQRHPASRHGFLFHTFLQLRRSAKLLHNGSGFTQIKWYEQDKYSALTGLASKSDPRPNYKRTHSCCRSVSPGNMGVPIRSSPMMHPTPQRSLTCVKTTTLLVFGIDFVAGSLLTLVYSRSLGRTIFLIEPECGAPQVRLDFAENFKRSLSHPNQTRCCRFDYSWFWI